mmetsp:Transcript_62053/g.202468  ORF Transcript_62053/g.202468 Transcript_62053/m.202468 type:complete len:213 (+) Transcript_62053:2178-2816(+)
MRTTSTEAPPPPTLGMPRAPPRAPRRRPGRGGSAMPGPTTNCSVEGRLGNGSRRHPRRTQPATCRCRRARPAEPPRCEGSTTCGTSPTPNRSPHSSRRCSARISPHAVPTTCVHHPLSAPTLHDRARTLVTHGTGTPTTGARSRCAGARAGPTRPASLRRRDPARPWLLQARRPAPQPSERPSRRRRHLRTLSRVQVFVCSHQQGYHRGHPG